MGLGELFFVFLLVQFGHDVKLLNSCCFIFKWALSSIAQKHTKFMNTNFAKKKLESPNHNVSNLQMIILFKEEEKCKLT